LMTLLKLWLNMAPPFLAALPANVTLVSVGLLSPLLPPSLYMAPPRSAQFPLKVTLVSVGLHLLSAPSPLQKRPPPAFSGELPIACPAVMMTPSRRVLAVMGVVVPSSTTTRKALSPTM